MQQNEQLDDNVNRLVLSEVASSNSVSTPSGHSQEGMLLMPRGFNDSVQDIG